MILKGDNVIIPLKYNSALNTDFGFNWEPYTVGIRTSSGTFGQKYPKNNTFGGDLLAAFDNYYVDTVHHEATSNYSVFPTLGGAPTSESNYEMKFTQIFYQNPQHTGAGNGVRGYTGLLSQDSSGHPYKINAFNMYLENVRNTYYDDENSYTNKEYVRSYWLKRSSDYNLRITGAVAYAIILIEDDVTPLDSFNFGYIFLSYPANAGFDSNPAGYIDIIDPHPALPRTYPCWHSGYPFNKKVIATNQGFKVVSLTGYISNCPKDFNVSAISQPYIAISYPNVGGAEPFGFILGIGAEYYGYPLG